MALAWLMVVPACAGSPAGRREDALGAGGPKYFQAPPKPGSSITASKQCGCYACDPDSCCGGINKRPLNTAAAAIATLTNVFDMWPLECARVYRS